MEAWNSIDKLSIIWTSDLSSKIKWDCLQTIAVSLLQYGCITCMQNKRVEKILDQNYTKMMWVVEQILKTTPSKTKKLLATCFHITQTTQDEQDMWCTAREAKTNSEVKFFYGLLHMDLPVLANQQRISSALCEHWMQSRRPPWSDGWVRDLHTGNMTWGWQ